ncbi:MAG: allophanate hydrolase [Burkholderiaceae bacterium]|nr:allophanate hydrolase [Burkholderiaceae bacterium]MCD8537818.1 allophanate hydrolase [Burkholderiaceae bacterium]
MLDQSLLTIADYRQAYAQGAVDAKTHLTGLWAQLDANGCGPEGDTALIYLPSAAQREVLFAALAQLDPKRCPLWGVPFVVKDNIDIAGWPTTAGCPEFGYVAQAHATVVEALIAAGAVPVAKANLDQFATGLVGTRSPYGWVRNAFSDKHISGGSSSGSASVVARGLVPFALGTDTAGSGRIPAGFNNLVGTKPTPGRFSIEGVVPACKTLDCVSIMSLTVACAAEVSAVLSSFIDNGSEPAFHAKPSEPKFAFPKALRVGVPANPVFGDAEYAQLFDKCIEKLKADWAIEPVQVDMTSLHAVADQLYSGPWVAERYLTAKDCIKKDVPGMDPTVKTIVSRGQGFHATDAFAALYEVKRLATLIDSMWHSIDVLLVPTAPQLPGYADVLADPIGANSALGIYTNFVNLLGWAALATPAGFTQNGLPFGVTWIAPAGSDEALLALGARWERHLALPLGRHLRDPELTDPDLIPCLSMNRIDSHPIAVVGAHLSEMPLNGQLQAAGARLSQTTTTSKNYNLYHLPNTTPPKPGLVRVDQDGEMIAVEVYDVPHWAVSGFLALIPSPLGLGKIELADGRWVTGFICEPSAVRGGYGHHVVWWLACLHQVAEVMMQTPRPTLADQAYQSIKARLAELDLLPGDRLSEKELAEQLGISRTPVRQAMQQLHHEGLLDLHPKHGWSVPGLDFERLDDLYDFRVLIEQYAISRCISSPDCQVRLEPQRAIWCVTKKNRLTDPFQVGQLDEQFHHALVKAACNDEMLRTHVYITERIRVIRRLDFIKPARIAATYDEHARILGLVFSGQLNQAKSAIKDHILMSKMQSRQITLEAIYARRFQALKRHEDESFVV